MPRVGTEALPPGLVPPFTTTLTFPAEGGTQDVFIARPSDCTISETSPPGCTLGSIDPATVAITEAPHLYPVKVTNSCASPSQSAASVLSAVPAAPAAAAVVGTPRTTG